MISYVSQLPRERKGYWKALDVLQAKLLIALLCDSSDNLAWKQFCMLGITPESLCFWREEYAQEIEEIFKNCFILWNFSSFLELFKGKPGFFLGITGLLSILWLSWLWSEVLNLMFKWGQGSDAEAHSIWETKHKSEINQESSRAES